jgi:5-formyltetrahydrofolate cyclo-ligase
MKPLYPEANPQVVRTKQEWRRWVIEAIAALDPYDRQAQETALTNALATLPGWSEARTVLLYVSAFPEEIDTAPLLSIAYAAGKRVVLPRVDRPARRLRLHAVLEPMRDLAPGVLGIPEPRADLPGVSADAIDWVLVPGLVFDHRGYRLGRGAGHYDRLLPSMRSDCICWSLCLSCQLVPSLAVEAHDVPLDGITSPNRTISGIGRSAAGDRAIAP